MIKVLKGPNFIMLIFLFFIIILLPLPLAYIFGSSIYSFIKIPFLLPIIVYFSLLFYALLFLLESFIILKIIFNPKEKEGYFELNKATPAIIYHALTEILMRINEKNFSTLLIPELIYANLIFKFFAKHSGKGNSINSINYPYLVSMGDDCVIGYRAIFGCHVMIGKKLLIKGIKIGNRVTLGADSIIGPGVIIEDDVIVGANSAVMPNSVLKKGGLYAGNPAKLKKSNKSLFKH